MKTRFMVAILRSSSKSPTPAVVGTKDTPCGRCMLFNCLTRSQCGGPFQSKKRRLGSRVQHDKIRRTSSFNQDWPYNPGPCSTTSSSRLFHFCRLSFAVGIELCSKSFRETRRYRAAVIVCGFLSTAMSYVEMERERRKSAAEREGEQSLSLTALPHGNICGNNWGKC
jgi:hypothetical protein